MKCESARTRGEQAQLRRCIAIAQGFSIISNSSQRQIFRNLEIERRLREITFRPFVALPSMKIRVETNSSFRITITIQSQSPSQRVSSPKTPLKGSSSALEIRTAVLSWDQSQCSGQSIPSPPGSMYSKCSSTMSRSRRNHHLRYHASHASNLGSCTGGYPEQQSTTTCTKRSTTPRLADLIGPTWKSRAQILEDIPMS